MGENATRRSRRDPSELTVEESIERWIARKRGSKADSTVREYGYQLGRFLEWTEAVGIEVVGELHPLDFDDYLSDRESDGVKPLTMSNNFKIIHRWVEYLESIGAVEDGLTKAVPEIDVPKGAEINETLLDPKEGDALIAHFREHPDRYGSRLHAVLEVFWFTACRLGALRGLDLRDVDLDNDSLEFTHRPDLGTPLKNGQEGERAVALPPATSDAICHYVDHNRLEQRDENGRQPLFTSSRGRPATDTIRCWSYQATQPCLRTECPHDERRSRCDWTMLKHSSKCPSSRSPHQVRTGAITRMLNRLPKERVEHRANTSQFQHYDMAAKQEKMEQRDREFVPDIELEANPNATEAEK